MKKIGLAIALVASLWTAGATTSAQAVPAGPGSADGLGTATVDLGMVEKTQFVYLGRNYCWYPAGWHGAGWYWCGYAWHRGHGWGGPRGWHGWVYRGRPSVHYRYRNGRRVTIHRNTTVHVNRGRRPAHVNRGRHTTTHVNRAPRSHATSGHRSSGHRTTGHRSSGHRRH
jgi:hypothetical protein